MARSCSSRLLTAACAAVWLVTSGCSGRSPTWETEAPAPRDDVSEAQAAQALEAGDLAWEERRDPAAIRDAIKHWETAAAVYPDMELRVKLTRAYYFLADGFLRGDDLSYHEALDEAVAWGEQAILASSDEFAAKVRAGEDLPSAVKVVPLEGVPAMYWFAVALGKWATHRGVRIVIGQMDNVKAVMERCLELQPDYYYGGPYRYFGAYYSMTPSIAGGDLEKAKVHFSKSLELAPYYVGTKVLWAESLAVKQQDRGTFTRLLEEVVETPADVIPELAPEIAVEQDKARELLARKDELF